MKLRNMKTKSGLSFEEQLCNEIIICKSVAPEIPTGSESCGLTLIRNAQAEEKRPWYRYGNSEESGLD